MEESRRRQQDQMRSRHDAEMEEQTRSRAALVDSHQRLKGLIEGQGMRSNPNEYKPPPNWSAPQGKKIIKNEWWSWSFKWKF